MKKCCGSFNTSGFSSQLQSASTSKGNSYSNVKTLLPSSSHITYAGMFNEMEFEIG